jgi:hypothetical protein
MRTILAITAAAAALAGCTMSRDGPVSADSDADGEVLLAEALAGRTAGGPVNCVRSQDVRNTRSAGGGRVLFDGPGNVVYVNQTSGSCPAIRPWHAIRHRTVGTNICSGELIRVFDPQSGVEYGGCSLGAFVPWRRKG